MSYEDQVYPADILGADVGQRGHSRITARSMVEVTAATGREQVPRVHAGQLRLPRPIPGVAVALVEPAAGLAVALGEPARRRGAARLSLIHI